MEQIVLKFELKFFLVCLLSLCLNISFGQTDTIKVVRNKAKFGLTFTTSVSVVLERFDYAPYLTIEKGNNFFAVGPVIGHNREIERYWSENFESKPDKKNSINGFHLVYQINPNQKARIFDFFFKIQIVFLNFKSTGVSLAGTSNYPYGYFYSNQSYIAKQRLISGLFGYGFKMKFLKVLYLTQSVNFGICQNYINVDYGGGSVESRKRLTPEMMFNLGLGCVFEKKKNK